MLHKQTKLFCPNCKRAGEFQIGPAKEQALCSCGAMIEMPQPHASSTIRRGMFITIVGGVIVKLLSPEWSIWDLFRRRVPQPLTLTTSETIHMSEMSAFHATVSHQLIRGNPAS